MKFTKMAVASLKTNQLIKKTENFMEKLKNNKILLILALAVVLISIFSAGKEFGHYLYQRFN